MTEEQKARRKEYMKKYCQDHAEEMRESRKKWYHKHKEQQYASNRAVYQRQKEANNTWLQRNRDKVNEYNRNYRSKRVEELRKQGITNAWSVFLYKKEPKYENN